MLSHSGCFRISSIISEISSAVVFLGLVVIIHLCKRISPAQHWSLRHLGVPIAPTRHFFVWSLSLSALPIAGSVVKDVKKDCLGEEDDESEPEPEPYHRGHLSEHERHLAPRTLAAATYALQLFVERLVEFLLSLLGGRQLLLLRHLTCFGLAVANWSLT